jgi:hypothetical protein
MKRGHIDPVRVIKGGIRYRARKRFLHGDIRNPFGDSKALEGSGFTLKSGMAELFDQEIQKLKSERLCPCCGQTTYGDKDV